METKTMSFRKKSNTFKNDYTVFDGSAKQFWKKMIYCSSEEEKRELDTLLNSTSLSHAQAQRLMNFAHSNPTDEGRLYNINHVMRGCGWDQQIIEYTMNILKLIMLQQRHALDSSNQDSYDYVMEVARNPETPSKLSEAIYKAYSINPNELEGILSFVETFDVLYPFAKRPVDDLTTIELGKHITEMCTLADIELAYKKKQMDSIVRAPMIKDFAKNLVEKYDLENADVYDELVGAVVDQVEKLKVKRSDKRKYT